MDNARCAEYGWRFITSLSMALLVLHLSDIHITGPQDPVLARDRQVAATLNPYLFDAEAVLIIFSGDIAQSGRQEEYEVAHEFLARIKGHILHERSVPLYVVAAPGNHDCNFSGDQESRLAVVGAIPRREGPMPASYIEVATAPQQAYRQFASSIESSTAVLHEDRLWKTHEIKLGNYKVILDCLNASWMSTMHEQQGGLLFPFEPYRRFTEEETSLRVAVLHHPFNWYSQMNYLQFRAFMQRLSDVIFTGHEHQSSGRVIDDADNGECLYVEGSGLQVHSDPNYSGFNVAQVDLASRRVRYIPHFWQGSAYAPTDVAEQWREYRALPKRDLGYLSLTNEFRAHLRDPGATLKHPSGISLTIDDIYVYPDLDVRFEEPSNQVKGKAYRKRSAKSLLDLSSMDRDVLLSGAEAAGKTQLLLRIFAAYHGQGLLPVLIKGKDLKTSAPADLDKTIGMAVRVQYGEKGVLPYRQAERARKVLLIDDLDDSPIRGESRVKLLTKLRAGYARTLFTVGQEFALAELFEGGRGLGTEEYSHYQISPFGYERRGELVRRWASIGLDETRTTNDLLKIADDAERLIEAARIQHIASTVPIYVLSLLQAAASGLSKELHNSSFAHYYYFLIVGALEKGGVSPKDMGPYIAVCTHLSWYIKQKGSEQRIADSEYRRFVAWYSEEWTETDPAQLLNVLKASRLIEEDGGYIYFAYPYAYYYFLGRYASISMEEATVQEYLHYCVSNLYVRECANTLLFLAHHTGNSQVLDHIVGALKNHFSARAPMSLTTEDVKLVSSLISHAPRITYREKKPIDFRQERARKKDEQPPDDGLAERPADAKNLFHEVISAIKSLEIAGALLTHQFANYQKVKKVDAVKQMFDGALRTLRELYSHFEEDPEQLIAAIAQRLQKGGGMSHDQAVLQARHQIGLLLRGLAAGLLSKAGVHVVAADLAAHVEEVVTTNPTPAYRLIRIAQKLHHPGRMPRADIEQLIKEEHANPCVMGPLQLLVLQRMYLYETDYDDKDWALSVFQLGASTNKAIEYRRGPHKLNWERAR